MKTTITKTNFRDMFYNAGRKDNFSYEGLGALFDYMEDYEESCDTEIECDVIAFCCEYSEYDSAVDCISDCGYNFDLKEDDYGNEWEDEDEKEDAAKEYLNENTMLITFEGGIIIQDF